MVLVKYISGKVLTVAPSVKGEVGGISFAVYNMLKYYEDRKVIETINYPSKRYFVLYFVMQVCRLVRLLVEDKEIKIVHIHFASKGSFIRKFLIQYVCKRFFAKKVVIHLHGGGFFKFYLQGNRILKILIEKFFNDSDHIIVLSETIKKKAQQTFAIKAEKISIVSNIAFLEGKPICLSIGKSDKLQLLFVGSIVKDKGVFDLVELFCKSSFLKEKVFLTIAGLGRDYDSIKEMINTCNLYDNIKMVGFVRGQDKLNYLFNCDCFILPSYFEALPVSILEAMSLGKAVISTNVGGVPDLVENEFNGLLFEPGNLMELEVCISRLAKNPQLLAYLGNNSKERYVSQFSADIILESIKGVYCKLIGS